MGPTITANSATNGTHNGDEYPATLDSASKRPTFYKANPHMSCKVATEEHVNTDIFNPSMTNPFTEGQGELPYY